MIALRIIALMGIVALMACVILAIVDFTIMNILNNKKH